MTAYRPTRYERLAAAEAAIDALRVRVEALERAASLWPPADRPCPACRGRGLERPTDVTCGACGGTGRVALAFCPHHRTEIAPL